MLKRENPAFSLLRGKRTRKSEGLFALFGDLDELNAVLGLAKAFAQKKTLKKTLLGFQNDLIKMGGFLARAEKASHFQKKAVVLEKKIEKLKDPRVKEFSRPGANRVSAWLHFARALTRRLERRLVGLKKRPYQSLVAYLNRLSLLLFWLAVKEERTR